MRYRKVINQEGWVRDIQTGMLINKDQLDKDRFLESQRQKQEIHTLRDKVSKLENMVHMLMEKK
jgi:hypothetical protein